VSGKTAEANVIRGTEKGDSSSVIDQIKACLTQSQDEEKGIVIFWPRRSEGVE
jgi:hypothetical protein